ncbi:MAG: orotate phosphoribosyltransferase [Desulfococcus sp. 4484_241]|nr:MAG: orotate phosphoribosyltransferase [Desulfococcus sp. 4484_241]
MMAKQHVVEETLLRIGAVVISMDPPFKWASGIRSPIYCDNRLLISYPGARSLVVDRFAEIVKGMTPAPGVIAGTATSGIPFAAWLADRLNLPMVYVRASEKAHGRGRSIEGVLSEGEVVVVIEDLISTGGSSAAVVRRLKEAGAVVTGLLSIFSYELEKAAETFSGLSLTPKPLATISSLLELAVDRGHLSREDAAIVNDFRSDPDGWYDRHFGK